MEKLAQAIAVSKSYISLLEAGERQPSREVVLKLAEALFPEGNSNARDELLILAGFAPINQDAVAAYCDAISIYEQSLSQNPQDFHTYLRLVYALIKAGRTQQAQEKIQQGMEIFSQAIQLQALLSTLELNRGNYREAIFHQETALRSYALHTQPEHLDIKLADLHFNLGAIYFVRGYEALRNFLQGDVTAKAQALADFSTAATEFETALQLAPQDVFIRDEYARLSFNQAYLLEGAEAMPYWERTIAQFKQVLISPHKQELSQHTLMESGAFLAHAYTKSQRFAEAELTLGLLESFNPNFWLIHYIQACFCSLRYAVQPDKNLLTLGLEALQRAIDKASSHQVLTEAMHDPDLSALRTARPRDFKRIIQRGEKQ